MTRNNVGSVPAERQTRIAQVAVLSICRMISPWVDQTSPARTTKATPVLYFMFRPDFFASQSGQGGAVCPESDPGEGKTKSLPVVHLRANRAMPQKGDPVRLAIDRGNQPSLPQPLE